MALSVSREQLNLIIAVSAILVSGASFYATYLQANSAEEQVKAMTWPLIEFTHGNYNVETREKTLTMELRNAGVGPAIVKSVTYHYQGQAYPSHHDFAEACCADGLQEYIDNVRNNDANIDEWTLTTSVVENTILPVGGQIEFFTLLNHPQNDALWQGINLERWKLQLDVCYCSLLEECYVTDKPGSVREVASCDG